MLILLIQKNMLTHAPVNYGGGRAGWPSGVGGRALRASVWLAYALVSYLQAIICFFLVRASSFRPPARLAGHLGYARLVTADDYCIVLCYAIL